MSFDKVVGSQFFIKDESSKPTVYRRTYDKSCRQVGQGELVR
jgi:hypothetical protein